MSDLVEDLRNQADTQLCGGEIMKTAADRIEALAAEVEMLRSDAAAERGIRIALARDRSDEMKHWKARAESAERNATAWHRVAETIATILGIPEPEADFAAKVRDKFDALNEQVHDANGVADLAIKHRDAAESALADAVEIMRPFARMEAIAVSESDEADYAIHVKSTVENQPQFRHFTAARDFITAQEKEKGK